MNLISLPALRHYQLQTIGEDSIKLCTGIPELETPINQVKMELNAFKTGMAKAQASGQTKKEIDTSRDSVTTGFMRAIDAEKQFPHTETAAIKALKNLVHVASKYGMKISRLPYNEETAAIDNFVSDVKKLDLNPLGASGLTRWIPLIENANEAFKEATEVYIKDQAQSQTIASATTAAPALVNALEGLYAMLFALIKVDGNDTHINVYHQLHTLVDGYRN